MRQVLSSPQTWGMPMAKASKSQPTQAAQSDTLQQLGADSDAAVLALRLIVYGTAQVKTIVPKRGESQGKEIQLLTFRAFHPMGGKEGEGQSPASIWLNVDCFNAQALALAPLLQDGMVLYASGVLKEHSYTAKDGSSKQSISLTAYQLALDLLQRGLSSFSYTRPPKQGQGDQHD